MIQHPEDILSMIGGILIYETRSKNVYGQTAGADGSGLFAIVVEGSPDGATDWVKDYLRKLTASGVILGSIAFVAAGECYTGPYIRFVTL